MITDNSSLFCLSFSLLIFKPMEQFCSLSDTFSGCLFMTTTNTQNELFIWSHVHSMVSHSTLLIGKIKKFVCCSQYKLMFSFIYSTKENGAWLVNWVNRKSKIDFRLISLIRRNFVVIYKGTKWTTGEVGAFWTYEHKTHPLSGQNLQGGKGESTPRPPCSGVGGS